MTNIIPKNEDIIKVDVETSANGDTYYHIFFKLNTKLSSIHDFLSNMQVRLELFFYDDEIPQWSDPGAYFSIIKIKNIYYISAGNHGWSTKYKKEKIENLAKLVWACIKYNNNENQGFRLSESKYKIVKCWWFSKAFGDVYKERMSLIQC